MEHPSNNNLLMSVLYWVVGQISFIAGTLTQYSTLEYIFKLLSIISVIMVIIINLPNFIKTVKSQCKKFKSMF